MSELKDFFGTVIKVGDYFMWPVHTKYHNIGCELRQVVRIEDGKLFVTRHNNPRVSRVQRFDRIAVAQKGWQPSNRKEAVYNG